MGRRRRRGYLARQYRAAQRAMRPNRVAARFISGGRRQTFKAIIASPLRTKTITTRATRRTQYRAHREKLRKQERRERERARRDAAAQRKAAAKRAAQQRRTTPRPPRPKPPPLAVDPRTGQPITYAQAMRALREAQRRAERLAAGLPGDAPPKTPRTPKAAPAKPAPRRTPKKPAKPRPKRNRRTSPPPDPQTAPGKNLRGLYLAATCPCQGTGRIATHQGPLIVGSSSCPTHGRPARGSKRVFGRRAMTDSGLPGLAAWLTAKPRRNPDRAQQRATRQARRERHAGPTRPCDTCGGDGTVNRALTDGLRADHISDLIGLREGAGKRVPSSRALNAQAARAYPYDLCRDCSGLGVVPRPDAGPWLVRTRLRATHTPTPREAATGKRRRQRS